MLPIAFFAFLGIRGSKSAKIAGPITASSATKAGAKKAARESGCLIGALMARKLHGLVCFNCKKGKRAAGRCMKCGRTYCLSCFWKHNYFLCKVKPAEGYPQERQTIVSK